MLVAGDGCDTFLFNSCCTVEMRAALLCLALTVACIQALKVEQNQESAISSAFGYLKNLWNGNDYKNEWPYVPLKTSNPRQSPIDLITSQAINRNLPTLEIVEPDLQGHQAKFYNSGHTVYVYMNDTPESRPQLKGGPLGEDPFYFEQMHFHWGSEDIWGSEHFIDGESYAAEIHLVHWNSKYGTYSNASTQPDGLAVLTIFAEGKNKTDNPLLAPLHSLLANVSDAGAYVMLDTNDAMQWAISALELNSEYYTYPGSLTTSPYTENVIFILLPKPVHLSYDQLHSFRTIHSSEGGDVTDNKRNLQPLHDRPIVRASNAQVE